MPKKILTSVILILLIIPAVTGQSENYIVRKASFSSPKFDEFSPVYYKGGLVFSSNRKSGLFSGYSTAENKAFFKMYEVDTSGNAKWDDPKLLPGAVNSNFNNGPATFNRRGDTIYFSRNMIVDGSFKDVKSSDNKLGIFSAVLKNGEWTEVTELRFNDNAWNVTTPFLSPDGKRLYFASDKPEGLGGSDLYYSQWRNGYWGNPVNLGRPVNTSGNEAYPFVNEAGELFFSSDSLPGKGGKDIFFTRYADSAWIRPIGLGPQINSPKDDFGFVADNSMSRGYFSSNRGNMMDIYSFRTINPEFLYCHDISENNYCYSLPDDAAIEIDPLNLEFRWDFGDGKRSSGFVVEHCFPGPGKYSIRQDIVDRKTRRVVLNKLKLELEISDNQMPVIKSDEIVVAGKPVSFEAMASSAGHKPTAVHWEFGNQGREKGSSVLHTFPESGEYQVKLLVNMREIASGKTTQYCVSKKIIALASSGEKVKVIADSLKYKPLNGSGNTSLRTVYSATDELERNAVFAVQLFVSEKKLDVSGSAFTNLPPHYVVRSIYEQDHNRYSYFITEELSLMAAYPSLSEVVSEGFSDAVIRTYIPSDRAEADLWNFKKTNGTSASQYFVNNGFSISQQGIPILDRLVLLLRRNPTLHLLVEAHTENSGSLSADLMLSEKQAQNIVDYLVSRGIERSRLSAAGFGGSRPIAQEYPDSERVKNRRLDFIRMN